MAYATNNYLTENNDLWVEVGMENAVNILNPEHGQITNNFPTFA